RIILEARDAEGGGGGGGGGGKVLQELYSIASDNVDVRFKFDANLSGFSAAGAYRILDGDLSQAKVQFKNLHGRVKAAFTGRLGQPGNQSVKVPVMNLPIVFNVPLPVEGIPFVVQIGADFLINVFLAGNHATLTVTGDYAFDGASGFNYSKASSSYTSDFSGGDPGVTSYAGTSLGASAVVLGAQLPRIGLGLSVLGASSMAYFDVVHVITMTQAPALGLLPCKRITYNAVGHVGIQTDVMPVPIEAVQQLAQKLSPKKEIFNHNKEVLDPPIKGCQI
ncbi:MAG: hypothetical protein JO274_03680, partial [Gammaproteobacteria bacterium]|nr:hypothetical protein [Gammaproteobacteria bacterium]